MPTASVAAIQAAVTVRFPGVRFDAGTNVRKIAGSNTWSQHSWGNAVDIYPSSSAQGDRIYSFLNSARQAKVLPIAGLCWKDMGGCNAAAHQDHLHVDGSPKRTGTPSGAGSDSAAVSTGQSIAQAVPGLGWLFGPTFTRATEADGFADAFTDPLGLRGAGIPELGLTANAGAIERIVTVIIGLLLVFGGLALIAVELRGTVIGKTIGGLTNAT